MINAWQSTLVQRQLAKSSLQTEGHVNHSHLEAPTQWGSLPMTGAPRLSGAAHSKKRHPGPGFMEHLGAASLLWC